MIKWIDQIESFAGKKVLVRVDYNTPLSSDGKTVTDTTRIRESLPTLRHLLAKGAKLILCSHLGRPKGRDQKFSMVPVGEQLAALLGQPVMVPEESPGDDLKRLVGVYQGDHVVLLENLRWTAEEESNSRTFAERLRALADVYVNDAFGSCHRAHASIDALPKAFGSERYGGLLLKKECELLGKIMYAPPKPFTLIVGGSKVSDKIGTLKVLVPKASHLVIGGAMAYTFLKAKGMPIGRSRFEQNHLETARDILAMAHHHNIQVHLPTDHKAATNLEDSKVQILPELRDDLMGLDIGPETAKAFSRVIESSACVFWNGPLGMFENQLYEGGTKEIAQKLANSRQCLSIIGGGDTAAAVAQFGLASQMSHVSTGGGASLEFLETEGKLPGLAALGV